MTKVQTVLDNLARVPSKTDALAYVRAWEKKRREANYIKYWRPVDQNDVMIEQEAEVFAAFEDHVKIMVVTGGNRSGKTEIGAAITMAWALGKEYFRGEPAWDWVQYLPIPDRASNIWIVGLDFPTLRDVIWREKLLQGRSHAGLLPKDEGIVDRVVDSDFQAFLANGSVITGKSADSGREKFQGASVDLIWLDEECDESVFDECYQRTVDCGGKILVTLTPLSDVASGVRTPWVYNLYEDAKEGQKDIRFVKLSVLANPYVPEAEKIKLQDKWAGHYEEKARLYGDFVQRSGLVYPMWDPKKHITAPRSIAVDWYRLVVIDPAPTGVTAALWGAVDPMGNITCYKEYYERDMVVAEHAKRILVRNAGQPVDLWLVDPKGGGQRNAETHRTICQLYRDSGIPCVLAQVGEDFGLQASMEYMNATTLTNSRLPKIYIFKDMPNFVDEMERYTWDRYERGPLKGLSKDKPRKGNDHLMNCLQYLCAQRPNVHRRRTRPSEDERARAVQVNSY